jgi:hypothetical protein
MDQQPSPAARPSVVTMVAIVLFVRGGRSILGGLVGLTGGSFLAGFGGAGTLSYGASSRSWWAWEIWAGTGILKPARAGAHGGACGGRHRRRPDGHLSCTVEEASSASRWMRSSSGRS